MKLCIENEEIMIGKEHISFGDSYEKILEQVKDNLRCNQEPDKDGFGFIILKDIEFYELKGRCTIHFREGLLKEIIIYLDWSLYDLNKEEWKGLNIVESVNKVASLNREELEKFSHKVEISQIRGTQEFETNTLLITTNIPWSDDSYTANIQKN